MLDFSKTILKGVCADRNLFNKELRKLVNWYGNNNEQKSKLHKWCILNFDNLYNDIITEVFVHTDKFDGNQMLLLTQSELSNINN